MGIRYLLITLLNIAFGIMTFLLGLRVVLKLFGANPATPIVSWVYAASESLLVPFRGIFPATEIIPGSMFDIPAFIALLAYGSIFYLVVAVMNMLSNSVPTDERRVSSDEHVHSHA